MLKCINFLLILFVVPMTSMADVNIVKANAQLLIRSLDTSTNFVELVGVPMQPGMIDVWVNGVYETRTSKSVNFIKIALLRGDNSVVLRDAEAIAGKVDLRAKNVEVFNSMISALEIQANATFSHGGVVEHSALINSRYGELCYFRANTFTFVGTSGRDSIDFHGVWIGARNSDRGGLMRINLEGGDDFAEIGLTSARILNINLGKGDDNILMGNQSEIRKRMSVNGGGGVDAWYDAGMYVDSVPVRLRNIEFESYDDIEGVNDCLFDFHGSDQNEYIGLGTMIP